MSRREENSVHFNLEYIDTEPCTLKFYCLVLVLVAYLLVSFEPNGVAYFFQSVTLIVFICTKDFLILNLFNITTSFTNIPWLKLEYLFCAASCIFLGLASLLILFTGKMYLILISFIGLAAMAIYGYDANLKYNEYYNAEPTEPTENI